MTDLDIPPGDEMMVLSASRMLGGPLVCFIGIGLPSAAAMLAQRACTPGPYLVYESGTLGPRPKALPLSVADDQLAGTAQTIVSVPEMFNYWLQAGRIDIGLLGTGQVDRLGHINTTVIGDYGHPRVRLPGAGGAPEITSACKRTVVMVRQSPRSLVESVDFITSFGHGAPGQRAGYGFLGQGTTTLVTDIGVYEWDEAWGELVLSQLHPDVTIEEARATCGWDLRTASVVRSTEPPTRRERQAIEAVNDKRWC